MWYVYAILCDDGSIYKGQTENLELRYEQHEKGIGSQHTRKHKPIRLVYAEEVFSQEEAIKREKYLKSGSGREMLKKKIHELNSEVD